METGRRRLCQVAGRGSGNAGVRGHNVTTSNLAPVPYPEAHGFGLERYIAEPLRIEDGFAIAPDRPGHGIAFAWDGLARFQA